MIDPRIKRAGLIALAVLVLAPLASAVWNDWMEGTQKEMIENQIKFAEHHRGRPVKETAAERAQRTARLCGETLEIDECTVPESVWDVRRCLDRLRRNGCDSLPEIHLCAAVEQLEICEDPFLDHARNGCDRLRETANCRSKPTPDELPSDLWLIRFDPD